MEWYLVEQYNVYKDEYLKSEDDIVEYFEDNGRDFFECGQGYYQEEAEIICKIGDKFYEVIITAEIGSAKQDIGDRLYWVEGIEDVRYEEISKPQPKEKENIQYNLKLTRQQRQLLEDFMKENYITQEDE